MPQTTMGIVADLTLRCHGSVRGAPASGYPVAGTAHTGPPGMAGQLRHDPLVSFSAPYHNLWWSSGHAGTSADRMLWRVDFVIHHPLGVRKMRLVGHLPRSWPLAPGGAWLST